MLLTTKSFRVFSVFRGKYVFSFYFSFLVTNKKVFLSGSVLAFVFHLYTSKNVRFRTEGMYDIGHNKSH